LNLKPSVGFVQSSRSCAAPAARVDETIQEPIPLVYISEDKALVFAKTQIIVVCLTNTFRMLLFKLLSRDCCCDMLSYLSIKELCRFDSALASNFILRDAFLIQLKQPFLVQIRDCFYQNLLEPFIMPDEVENFGWDLPDSRINVPTLPNYDFADDAVLKWIFLRRIQLQCFKIEWRRVFSRRRYIPLDNPLTITKSIKAQIVKSNLLQSLYVLAIDFHIDVFNFDFVCDICCKCPLIQTLIVCFRHYSRDALIVKNFASVIKQVCPLLHTYVGMCYTHDRDWFYNLNYIPHGLHRENMLFKRRIIVFVQKFD
jgi:hypothetical protein